MIFAVAGTQLPFARLFGALEMVAARHQLPVIAQTGEAGRTSASMECHARIAPARFEAIMAQCDVVVAHAGIGVIIAAATHRKPLILMPRRASLGEHRNDHQLATAAQFRDRPGIMIVHDEAELEAALLRVNPPALGLAGSERREALIGALRAAIV